MEKEKRVILGNVNYLLGKNQDGQKVWLEEASWDCEWYWGFGYIETYNQRYSDIEEHTHFDSLFLKNNIFDSFKEYFTETVLTDNEIWKLLELMKETYIIREYSDLLHRNGGNISKGSDKLEKQKEKNLIEYKRINEEILPEIFKEVYKILEEDK